MDLLIDVLVDSVKQWLRRRTLLKRDVKSADEKDWLEGILTFGDKTVSGCDFLVEPEPSDRQEPTDKDHADSFGRCGLTCAFHSQKAC